MTTPAERTRNLVQVGAFLKELREGRVPASQIANEAHRLLRHYPTLSEFRLLARFEDAVVGQTLLTTEFAPEWVSRYPLGPHTG